MSVTVQYLLQQEQEEEKRKKEAVPGVAPVTTQEGTPDLEQVQPAPSFQEEHPATYEAYDRLYKPKNRSALPPPETEHPQDIEEEYPIVEQTGIELPEGSFLSDEYVEVLRSVGFSNEQIASLGQSADPQDFLNGITSRSYKQSMQEPDVPDEKKMKRQRAFAAIGDALGLVSQAAGAAQGAHVRERKFEEGAMARLSENQQRLYNRYLQRADNYSRGLVNAHMQDYIQGHRDWKDTQQQMIKTLADYRKEKIAAAKQAQKDAIEREKLDNAERKLDASIKDSDRRLTIAEQNARTAAARAEGYNKRAEAWVRKLEDERANPSRGNNIEKHDYEIMIPAHPDDPNAFENDDGELVTIIGTSRAEKDYLIKQAMEDEEFIASLEKSNRALAGAAAKGDLSVSQRNSLADYYLQRRYNNQFTQSEEGYIDPLARIGAVGDTARKQAATDTYTEVVSDDKFMDYVKRRNKDMHNAIKEGEVTRKDERDYIVSIYDEWMENGRQDPVETTIQEVQDTEDEMNPYDEFKIVGTI